MTQALDQIRDGHSGDENSVLDQFDRTRALPWIIGLSLAAIALRFVQLGQESFWTDEVNSLNAVRGGVIKMSLNELSSPPLYHFLLKGWMSLFGEGHFAVRSLSAILGGSAVGAIFYCARRWSLGGGAPWVIALWLMTHPVVYAQSQQNRYYALLLLLGILWVSTFPSLLRSEPRRTVCWPHVVIGFLGFTTHYYFAFYALAGGMGVLLWGWIESRKGGEPPCRRLISTEAALALAMAMLSPLVFVQFSHGPMGPKQFLDPPTVDQFAKVFTDLYPLGLTAPPLWGRAVGVGLFALAIGCFAYAALRVREDRRQSRLPIWLLLFLAIVPNLLAFAASFPAGSIFLPDRYSLLFLPAFILWTAAGWTVNRGRFRLLPATIAIAIVVSSGLTQIRKQWKEFQMFDWRGAIRITERDRQPGDIMVFCPDWMVMNYKSNGGEPFDLIPSSEIGKIRESKRVWLFAWEQAPEHHLLEPLVRLRTDAENPFVIHFPDITLSLIPQEAALPASPQSKPD